jgi:hypothetical protein
VLACREIHQRMLVPPQLGFDLLQRTLQWAHAFMLA